MVLPAASDCERTQPHDQRALIDASRFPTSNAALVFASNSGHAGYLAALSQSRLALREALNLRMSLDWLAARTPFQSTSRGTTISRSQLLHLVNLNDMGVDIGVDHRVALLPTPQRDVVQSVSAIPVLTDCSGPVSVSLAQVSSLKLSSSPSRMPPTPLSRSSLGLTKCMTKRDTLKVLKYLGSSPRIKSDPFIDVVVLPHLDAVCAERSSHDDDSLFPDRLCAALASAEREGFCDVVSWCRHGRAFQIRDRRRFLAEIMPRYFSSMGSWSSFTRQLSFWGFSRARAGVDAGCYYHELVVRGLNLTGYVRRIFFLRPKSIA
jgi:HSF-type DNA-binding